MQQANDGRAAAPAPDRATRASHEAHGRRCASLRFPAQRSLGLAKTTATTSTGRMPRMGRHSSGQARITLGGKVHYLGRWASPEAHARYAELVRAWLDNGKRPL